MSDADYTLIQQAIDLGGRVVSVLECDGSARVPFVEHSRNEGGADGHTLSKAHISPFVEYRTGAGLLKAHRGGMKDDQIGGGQRGVVKGFSDASRRRLLYTIRGIKLDADLPLFITLTYPKSFPNAHTSKKHLDTFFKRFSRAFPGHGSIWKLEPQKRGAPHYHILTWACDLEAVSRFVPNAWFDIAGGDDINHLKWHMGMLNNQHCVQQVYNKNGVLRYASKYLGKTFEVTGWDKVGRYWGIINRNNIPFGELVKQEVTQKKAVEIIRYQKRFSGLTKRNNRSMTIFCDADQWIKKLEL